MARAQKNSEPQGGPAKATAKKIATYGFGVPATSDPHHFIVNIPKANAGQVEISEHLGMQAESEEFAVIDRVLLERIRWTAIRSEVQRNFNARLKNHGVKTCSWKVGKNPVDRLLGRELCVLAWAVEGMAMENIPIAVRNWLALRPEERWWLFGMTSISTGAIKDAGKGWRLALRHALGDVAQSDQLRPKERRIFKNEINEPRAPYLDLFGEER